MNYNGEDIISAVAKRLNKIGTPPTDSNIIQEIKKLNKYELAELINFGTMAKWVREASRNDIIKVTEMLYREENTGNNMDVPSFAYEKVEAANKRRIIAKSELTLYDWCKEELNLSNEQK